MSVFVLLGGGLIVVALLTIWFASTAQESSSPVRLVSEEELPSSVQQLRGQLEFLIQDEQYDAAADVLRRIDVTQLVDKAVQANDLRWMAIYEDDLVLPGLGENTRVTAKGNEYWVIPGTSDAILSLGWQVTATEFARKYNTLLQKSASLEP